MGLQGREYESRGCMPLRATTQSPAHPSVNGPVSASALPHPMNSFTFIDGTPRLALDLVRVCSQYTMPSYDPDGRALSAAEFRELLDTHSPHCFFSHELCAKYFTCRTEDNSAHFILFDDMSTVSQRIEIAESLGFCAAFLLYRDFGGGCRQLFAANG